MFGYVKINKPELLVKDYETYHAIYCGLCKALGHRYSVFSRMSLNYDYTLFALLLLSMEKEEPTFRKQGCLFNPLCRNKCCNRTASLDRAADALVIATWFKLDDDLQDDGSLKRSLCRFLRFFYRPMARKAKKQAPDTWDRVEDYMKEQRRVEQSPRKISPDEAAEPTARYLADFLAGIGQKTSDERILSQIGYNVGKWIYWIDAADDLQDDVKHGSFNPWVDFCSLTKENLEKELPAVTKKIRPLLDTCINEAAKALDLLPVKRYEMILKNIVYLGLPKEQERVLLGLTNFRRKKGT